MDPLSTDCDPLDDLLDGGLEPDAITLVFGEGGSGKTNLALQCARVATAAGKRVAFVDTEGVSAARMEQIFAHVVAPRPDDDGEAEGEDGAHPEDNGAEGVGTAPEDADPGEAGVDTVATDAAGRTTQDGPMAEEGPVTEQGPAQEEGQAVAEPAGAQAAEVRPGVRPPGADRATDAAEGPGDDPGDARKTEGDGASPDGTAALDSDNSPADGPPADNSPADNPPVDSPPVGPAATGRADAQRVLFYTPFSIDEQERAIRQATRAPDLGLVVVDSINMHYRLHIDGGEDMEKQASRSLYAQLHHLTNFARKFQVPVLITGQVFGAEDSTQPFARRTMEHLVKALVRFEKRPDGSRRATVLKHRSIEEGRRASFRIAAHGLVGAGGAMETPPDPMEHQ